MSVNQEEVYMGKLSFIGKSQKAVQSGPDGNCVWVAPAVRDNGAAVVAVSQSSDMANSQSYTEGEWRAFEAGVKSGQLGWDSIVSQ